MNIALIEPFYGGSHKKWCEGLQKHSDHNIIIFSLSAHHWKWRMHAAAITLANQVLNQEIEFNLFVVSDFLDLALFRSLLGPFSNIPILLYFHENQITYPWNSTDPDVILNRNNTYGFINYTSALIADQVYFNSEYHEKSFTEALPTFLKQFPDHQNLQTIESIKRKSDVLPLGLCFDTFRRTKPLKNNKGELATILWNHRWEYDKNPEEFFESLYTLKKNGVPFNLIVLGQQMKQSPSIFREAKKNLKKEIVHWGYCESEEEYSTLLWNADIIPVTSNQDFFGISLVEALYCNVYPLLPPRLAYAEHFHDEISHFEYNNQDELIKKLTWCCRHADIVRNTNISSNLIDYSWRKLAPRYDACFDKMIGTKKGK